MEKNILLVRMASDFFFFFFVEMRFELRASCLQSRHYHFSHMSTSFYLFGDGGLTNCLPGLV
jgi:hypothetical protein